MNVLPNKHYNTDLIEKRRRRRDNPWKMDLEKEMETTGFKYNWGKNEDEDSIPR